MQTHLKTDDFLESIADFFVHFSQLLEVSVCFGHGQSGFVHLVDGLVHSPLPRQLGSLVYEFQQATLREMLSGADACNVKTFIAQTFFIRYVLRKAKLMKPEGGLV